MPSHPTRLAAGRPSAGPLAGGGLRARHLTAAADRAAATGLTLCLAAVLAGGLGAYAVFGPVVHGGFDPPGLVDHLGGGRDLLAAPFARWDSVWFLTIARDGYGSGAQTAAFFPLYPLLVAAVGALGPGLLVGGVAVSVICLFVALRLLWRLTELELGARWPAAPGLAVLAAALGPMSFFLTAVYSESLYLALSLGAFLAARQGRWARAGALGALAAATRSQGLLLLGALGLLFVEQRRGVPLRVGRRPPGASVGAGPRGPRGVGAVGLPRPRRRDAAWLLAIPLGAVAFAGWLWLAGVDPLAPLRAQQAWYRHFTGPLAGIADGARAAWAGVEQLASGPTRTVYFTAAGGDPLVAAVHNLTLFGFLLAAAIPVIGAWRRLPLAYGAYATAAVLLAVSYPVTPQPLMSLPRFLVVLFPLPMVVGAWLADHPRWRHPGLGASAGGLAACSGLFATWHWIA